MEKDPPRVTSDHYRLAMERILATARKAQTDLPTFHEFVQRDEATQSRIRTLPFQRLIFDFIETFHKCVLMLPPGFSKTNLVMSRTIQRLGQDPTRRIMYLSKDTPKATKFVSTVKTIIESSPELRLVFPNLKPTDRQQETWSSKAITVDRPIGIKDPSLVAASEKMGVAGFRLTDIIVDDVVDQLNSTTPEAREKIWRQHEDVLLHRLDKGEKEKDTRYTVINTAFNSEDFPHRLLNSDPSKWGEGWPGLIIDVFGNVYIYNVPTEDWDPPMLRPAKSNMDSKGVAKSEVGPFRIGVADDEYAKATGDDPDNAPLWWPKFTHERIKAIQATQTEVGFNQAYRIICRSEETAKCKSSWIEACLDRGVNEGHHSMVAASFRNPYQTSNPVVMGVDLSFGVGTTHDHNSFAIWEFLEDGSAKLLDIQTIQCANATFVRDIIYEKAMGFGDCNVVVETVGAQKMMKDILHEKDRGLKLRAFNTSGAGATNKWDAATGVESIFGMAMNHALILPRAPNQPVHPEVRKLVEACIYYLPSAHTADCLMACWFAIWYGRQLHAYRMLEKNSTAGGLLAIGSR